jgi:hypothetical protein
MEQHPGGSTVPEREANPYKIINQYKRAMRLYEILRQDAVEYYGELAQDPHALAAMIHDMEPSGWESLAERVQIDPPSDETIERIVELANIAVEVADFVAEHPLMGTAHVETRP